MSVTNRIHNKLKSERGASLSMALMLFLVCTVVASVVLVAGSATAGRLSQLREMDGSYYNVASAAKLLWDELSDSSESSTVTFVRECDVEKDENGEYQNATNWTLAIDGTAYGSGAMLSDSTLFQMAAYDIMFRDVLSGKASFTSANERVVSDSIIESGLAFTPAGFGKRLEYDSFEIELDDSESEAVTVKVVRDSTGDLVFGLAENGNDSSLKLNLRATVDIDEQEPLETRISESTYHVEFVTTVSWTPQNVDLGGGAA